MERGAFAHSERQDGRAHTADPVGHSKRAGICMPRTEATGEANPASTLTLDVQPPELGQKLLPVVEATNLQYFVPVAPADHARWDNGNYCHVSGVAEPGGRLHGRCFKAEHPAQVQHSPLEKALISGRCTHSDGQQRSRSRGGPEVL